MESENIYSLEWTNKVKTVGRVFVYNERLWLSFSGTGIEFECSGGFSAKLEADMIEPGDEAGFARYIVFRDGVSILDERLTGKNGSICIEAEGVHKFSVIKVSESANSSLGIYELRANSNMTDEDGNEIDMRPVENNRHRIEIIGDSITCGYGVEGDLSQTFTTATENVSLAWSYLTAKKLNMDYSICSKSGAGIISGYTGDGVKNTDNIIVGYYEKMGCTQYAIEKDTRPQSFDYDFSFEPDVVTVLLGTNDISYCHPVDLSGKVIISEEEEQSRRREFYSEYKKFLQNIRRLNPFAKIVCALGVMGTELNNEAETAVNEMRAEGDSRIFWIGIERQDDKKDGYGTDYHPSKTTQRKLADTMSEFIASLGI